MTLTAINTEQQVRIQTAPVKATLEWLVSAKIKHKDIQEHQLRADMFGTAPQMSKSEQADYGLFLIDMCLFWCGCNVEIIILVL